MTEVESTSYWREGIIGGFELDSGTMGEFSHFLMKNFSKDA